MFQFLKFLKAQKKLPLDKPFISIIACIILIKYLLMEINFYPSFVYSIAIVIYIIIFTEIFLVSKPYALAIYITSIFFLGHLSSFTGYSIRSLFTAYFLILLFLSHENLNTLRKREFILPIILFIILILNSILHIFLNSYSDPIKLFYLERLFKHYSIWISSFMVGYLSILSISDFYKFGHSLNKYLLIFVFTFPLSYLNVLINYFKTCHPIFLSLGNINRSDVAYVALVAYIFSLSSVIKNSKGIFLSIIALIIILFSGSKAPLIMLFIFTMVSIFYMNSKYQYIYILILIFLLSFIYFNCSFHNTYFNSLHSFSTRMYLLNEALLFNLTKSAHATVDYTSYLIDFLFGKGEATTIISDFLNGVPLLRAASGNLFFDFFNENGMFGLIILFFLIKPFFVNVLYFRSDSFLFVCLIVAILLKNLIASETYNEYLLLIFVGISSELISQYRIHKVINS